MISKDDICIGDESLSEPSSSAVAPQPTLNTSKNKNTQYSAENTTSFVPQKRESWQQSLAPIFISEAAPLCQMNKNGQIIKR